MLASLGRWSSENSIEHMETGQFYTDNLLYSSLIFHESLGLPLKLLRSVKTEEDAPTHNTIWARKWNKSEKRNDDDIFNDCWWMGFMIYIIQSSKNQWASFLKKRYFTCLEIEKDLKKDAKVHFFSRKISLLQDQWENNFYLHNIGIKSKWIMIG